LKAVTIITFSGSKPVSVFGSGMQLNVCPSDTNDSINTPTPDDRISVPMNGNIGVANFQVFGAGLVDIRTCNLVFSGAIMR
jgi:hypothetical protein